MNLLSFLLRHSRGVRYSRLVVFLTVFMGIASGLVNTALLAVINASLNREDAASALLWAFAGLCLLMPLTRFLSEVLLLRLTQGVMLQLRLNLSRKILAAPVRSLEEIGPARLVATLTEDIPSVSNALIMLPLLCLHCAVVVSCLGYLGWLSWGVLLCVVFFMAVGVASYQLPTAKAMKYLKRGRDEWDALIKHFRAMTDGVKELKLHGQRRAEFLSGRLEPTALALRRHSFKGNAIYAAARSWGQTLFFVLIGLILYVLPAYQAAGPRTQSGYILTLLYMMTPLEAILNSLPIFARAKVSMQKVQEMGLSLASQPEDGSDAPAQVGAPAPWSEIEVAGATHAYYCESEENNFTLGPIDLTFRPGEIVFLAGGNGSGKTTLAKLITGLYIPESGEIRLDGRAVDDETRESYRQNFSAVFSDFYLFDELLGLGQPSLDAQARHYLAQLQLEGKVKVEGGRLSTIDLSQGQRKRLALLTAYLEDRPFYVFDEWAADQDPLFKNVFYLYLLPELKARGKTVLVISHDDRYFHLADRLVKLNYGKVESAEPIDELQRLSMATPVVS